MKINLPLLALATGAFGIGITEFAPMGLLPDMAEGLGVSIPAAGLLVSAYALGVMLGAPLMTLTTARMNRRSLLIALMGDIHARQFPVGDRGRLFDADGRARDHVAQPWRLLWRRIGRRREPCCP